MALTPQGVPTEPGLTYVNVARSLPFQYTFRGDDITEFNPATRDLFENRDRELELSLININGAIPIGGVTMFGGLLAAIPFNYLPCDGRTLNTTEFADLFSVIGYRYGGSGANFILPDLFNVFATKSVSTDGTSTTGFLSTDQKFSTGHTHTLTSPQSSGHTHNFNQTGNTSSSGHNHSISASTGDGGVDHFHGGNTGNANANHAHSGNTGTNSVGHTHTYFKANSGANNNTGGVSVNHTHGFNTSSDGAAHSHSVATGLSSAFNHAHNAAANISGTNVDTAHVHNASTIANSNADTAHTHTASATNTDAGHNHTIAAIGFYFIIRYQ
jgi:microcystin-dependent protein